MNLRNSYDPSDTDIPLEFQYQPANGHLWYTSQMTNDKRILWNDVARMLPVSYPCPQFCCLKGYLSDSVHCALFKVSSVQLVACTQSCFPLDIHHFRQRHWAVWRGL
ncbi:hypothetical protein BDZ91DRAFT_70967 [Kalaharituber pfeilii]|nr:hypothetical protein BDZ91DRAFT_70967 [Kalaharituber pfeilii]